MKVDDRAEAGIGVRRLHPKIGAEISDIDLSKPLSTTVIDELRQLLLRHKVIFFRDQPITRRQFIDFARSFGELEMSGNIEGYPELGAINADEKVSLNTNFWHSDYSCLKTPSMGAMLRSVEIPEVGGDTLFADMVAAYEGLPDEVKQRISNLVAVHDALQYFAGYYNYDKEKCESVTRRMPPQEHPVVRTHPETGEKILYVNKMYTKHIKGLTPAESDDLLSYLFDQAKIPEYQMRFTWRKHSIAFWDNRSTQHYASADYWPERRIMERLAFVGDEPY